MSIVVIGDSHTCMFSGDDRVHGHGIWPHSIPSRLPEFQSRHIGPRTAYGLTYERIAHALHDCQEGSYVMLGFGEIDCYLHLAPQAHLQRRPLELVVEDCVARYMTVVRQVRTQGLQVMVNNVIPSQPWDLWTEGGRTYQQVYPETVEAVEENEVNLLYNAILAQHCEHDSIPFVSTFGAFVGPDGRANLKFYTEDYHHLNMSAMPTIIAATTQAIERYRS